MKNLSLILNAILFVLVATLFYLRQKDQQAAHKPAEIVPPASASGGMKIAYVNADTLDLKYEWLKQQREALEKRLTSLSATFETKMRAHQEKSMAFQQKAEAGNTPPAELQKEYEILAQQEQRLQQEGAKMEKSLGEDRQKAIEGMYTQLEAKLKTLRDKIGYDYILSYSRGGQILMANDSLDITNQVLELLNEKQQ
jgi:outer membrane protein